MDQTKAWAVKKYQQKKGITFKEIHPWLGHEKTSTTDEQIDAIYYIVLGNRHLTLKQKVKN